MIQKVLETGTSGTTYVVIALVLFFSVFVSVVVREILRPRREVQVMADMPLEDEMRPATSNAKDGV